MGVETLLIPAFSIGQTTESNNISHSKEVNEKRKNYSQDVFISKEKKDYDNRSFLGRVLYEAIKIGSIIVASILATTFLSSLITTGAILTGIGMLVGGLVSAGFSAYEQYNHKREVDFSRVALEFGLGFITIGAGKLVTGILGKSLGKLFLRPVINATVDGSTQGALIGGTLNIYDQAVEKSKISWFEVATSFLIGAVVGGLLSGGVKKLALSLPRKNISSSSSGNERNELRLTDTLKKEDFSIDIPEDKLASSPFHGLPWDRPIPTEIHPAKSLRVSDQCRCIYPLIEDGQSVLIGGGGTGDLWLKCNYSALQGQLEKFTPEFAEASYQEYRGSFQKSFEQFNFDEDLLRRIFFTWKTASKCRKILGDVYENNILHGLSYDSFPITPRILQKPLSDCVGKSMCSEYAALAHFILRKAGIRNCYVNGGVELPGDCYSMHAYIVLDNGMIFDPTRTAHLDQCWLPKLYLPSANILQNKELVLCKNIFTGGEMLYGF